MIASAYLRVTVPARRQKETSNDGRDAIVAQPVASRAVSGGRAGGRSWPQRALPPWRCRLCLAAWFWRPAGPGLDPMAGRMGCGRFRRCGHRGWRTLASETTGVSGMAERYTAALFDIADERRMLDEVASDLRQLRAMLAASVDLSRLVRSPVLTRGEQGKAISALAAQAGFSPLVRDFLAVVAKNRRLFAVPAMIEAYLAKLAERRGEVTAEVIAAQPLSQAQLALLSDQLRRTCRTQGFGRTPGRSGADRRDDRQGGFADGRQVAQEQVAAAAVGDEGHRLSFRLEIAC